MLGSDLMMELISKKSKIPWTIFSVIILAAAVLSGVLLCQYVVNTGGEVNNLQRAYILNIFFLTIFGLLISIGSLSWKKPARLRLLLAWGCAVGALYSVFGVIYDVVGAQTIGLLTNDGGLPIVIYLLADIIYVILNLLLMLYFLNKLKQRPAKASALVLLVFNISYFSAIAFYYLNGGDRGLIYPLSNGMVLLASIAVLFVVSKVRHTE
jgi:glucan phosphoethanolaminetransferase (alkaline phosphatase superfamily)